MGRFVIEQLTGERRRLELMGGFVPFKGYAIGGVMATAKERNAGNPYAVQHVFGADEDDTEVKGKWDDVLMDDGTVESAGTVVLLDGSPVTNIRDLVAVTNAMWREGQEVEVRWLHTIRRGIIKAFHANYLEENLAEWDMKFEWNSPSDLDGNRARAVPINTDVSEVAADMNTRASRLASMAYRPYAAEASVWQQIDDQVTAISVAAGELDDAATVAFSAGGATDGLRRAAATLSTIEASAEILIGLANGRPDRLDYALLDQSTMTMGEVLVAARNNRHMCREAREIRGAAARSRYSMAQQSNPELIDVHTAVDGDDLRRLCLYAYGTDDCAYALARYNGIRDPRLTAGQVVYFPRQIPGTRQS